MVNTRFAVRAILSITRRTSFFLIFLLFVFLTACDSEPDGKINITSSSRDFEGAYYQDVVNELTQAGFVNVKTEIVNDLIFGLLTSDGEVEKVSINGDTTFNTDNRYFPDDPIIITYHTFEEDDEPKAAEVSDESEIETQYSTAASEDVIKPSENVNQEEAELLEAVFPSENARRAAVVALTNATVSDVFADDGNTYDITKFHSYADVSGEYLLVISDGKWTPKDNQTWSGSDIVLENPLYDTRITVNLDVSFTENIYQVRNLSGKIGDYVDISEYENVNDPIYLTVSPDLILEDRDEDELTALDHSGDLDKQIARLAFEQYGEEVYPYGFECHWIIGLINEEQTSEGSWIFKVEATVTNQFGTEMDMIAEGTVSGTDALCKVESFYAD